MIITYNIIYYHFFLFKQVGIIMIIYFPCRSNTRKLFILIIQLTSYNACTFFLLILMHLIERKYLLTFSYITIY